MPPPSQGRFSLSCLVWHKKTNHLFLLVRPPRKGPPGPRWQVLLTRPTAAWATRQDQNRGRGGGPFSIEHQSHLPVSVGKTGMAPGPRPMPCCSALDASTRAHYTIYGRTDIHDSDGDGDGGDENPSSRPVAYPSIKSMQLLWLPVLA